MWRLWLRSPSSKTQCRAYTGEDGTTARKFSLRLQSLVHHIIPWFTFPQTTLNTHALSNDLFVLIPRPYMCFHTRRLPSPTRLFAQLIILSHLPTLSCGPDVNFLRIAVYFALAHGFTMARSCDSGRRQQQSTANGRGEAWPVAVRRVAYVFILSYTPLFLQFRRELLHSFVHNHVS